HFDSKHSVSIDGIYDFQVNVCNNPEDMQKQLLTVHKNDHGYLPDYNKELVAQKNIEGNACP
ncbi:MAG: hypothetical protein GY865_06360, partial [candidate division Zixibacteria bacterium]|nr:hypothetical protein [candidate division Zixibacteria bacterium]